MCSPLNVLCAECLYLYKNIHFSLFKGLPMHVERWQKQVDPQHGLNKGSAKVQNQQLAKSIIALILLFHHVKNFALR